MTVQEVLSALDELCPNQYATARKLAWLSALEGQLYAEIAARHEATAGLTPPAALLPDTVLLVEDDYAGLYLDYLQAKVAQANGETQRCADAAADFQTELRNYWNACTRRSLPLREAPRLKVL